MSKPSFLRSGLPVLAGLAVLLAAGVVAAAEPVRYTAEKKLRLHIDTDLFGWTQGRTWYEPDQRPDPDPHSRVNIIGFGALRPLLIDRGAGGVADFGAGAVYNGGSMFALGLGYGVHRHVVVGARLGLAFDRLRSRNDLDMNPDSFTAFRYFGVVFTPYIEVLPLSEGRILPYFLFRTGFAGSMFGARSYGEPATEALLRESAISPTLGVGAGAHFFLIPQFSFDLGLNFDYRWNFTRELQKSLATGDSVKSDWERNSQAFNLGLNLGLSVWFF